MQTKCYPSIFDSIRWTMTEGGESPNHNHISDLEL